MRKERLYHSIRLSMLKTPKQRAAYLKKNDVLAGIGENCGWGPALLPLYAKLIRLHDNVYIHKTAKLVPHDYINRFLRDSTGGTDFGHIERIGCIEIMDNVYVSMNVTILPDVRIGKNCIISTGSVVTSDVPDNSIVAGNPAKVIGSFDSFTASRLIAREENYKFTNQALPADIAEKKWKIFEERHAAKAAPAAKTPVKKQVSGNAGTKERIIRVLSENINGVDFENGTDLIDSHQLDSLGLLSVIAHLENEFDCPIPFDKVNAVNFNDVSHMASLMDSLLGNTAVKAETEEIEQTGFSKELLVRDIRDTEKPNVQRILEYAVSQPEETAIIANDKETSYRELADMIVSISRWMQDKGVKTGDCVTVQALHEDTCIACYFAIQLLGAILVPVEKSAAAKRILEISEDTKSVLIVSLVKGEGSIPWHEYSEVRNIAHDHSFDPAEVTYPDIDLPCEMIFTTGTTGKSKGVLMTHRHMSWYAYSIAGCVQMKKGNRFLLTTPLNHAGGLRRTHLLLANGCCIVYLDGLSDLAKYFSYIRKYKVTSLYLPPVAVRILLSRTGNEMAKFKDQIDFVYSSSSSLPAGDCEGLRKLLPNTRLYNAYEASETPGVSAYDYNRDNMTASCIGKANEGVELAVMLEDGTITKEPKVQGQICVKSRMNMKEYYLEPELTASVMKDGWFVSNDLGYLDEEGALYMQGRKGDVINLGGYKIAPTDVEETALQSGMIDECICIEAFDEFDVPFIKLLVVTSDRDAFSATELNAFLSSRLEAYKVPRAIEIVDSVNKTFNGKIDRKSYRKGSV